MVILKSHKEEIQRFGQHKSLKLHLSWLTRVKFLSYTWTTAYFLEYTMAANHPLFEEMGSIQAGIQWYFS